MISDMDGLRGQGVLVTRPAPQAAAFSLAVGQRGGKAIGLPVIEIEPIVGEALQASLDDVDVCIFVSLNAVEYGAGLLKGVANTAMQTVAVGSKTAASLSRAGVTTLLKPRDGFTSEAVLALPELQDVRGKRIVIFRGEGGREKLGDELTARGAAIKYLEVYRRVVPQYSEDDLASLLDRGAVTIAAITSVEGLVNLREIAGKTRAAWLKNLPLLVGSGRIQAAAEEYGFRGHLVLADDPTDNSMLAALLRWADTRGA